MFEALIVARGSAIAVHGDTTCDRQPTRTPRVVADITTLDLDAIVSAANSGLSGGARAVAVTQHAGMLVR
jgi:hypothetical protein